MKDHRRVVAALAKRDDELARAAMSEHLAAGATPLIDHLTDNEVWSADLRRHDFRR